MPWYDKFFQRAPRVSVPKAGARAIQELSLWNQFQRVGGGLSPAQVSSIIRDADGGYMTRLMDLANDARQKDGHLHAILATNEETIVGLDWQLNVPEDAKLKERKAGEFITDALKRTPSLSRLIGHLAGATYYGYAVSEILWKKESGKLVPDCFEQLAPRRFAYRQSDGRFIWRDDGMDQNGIEFDEEFQNKFVQSHPRVNGDVPCREGLVRVLMWAALFRNWTVSDWLRLGEIAWKPWRIGEYTKNANKEDVDGLVNVLDGMSTNGVAIVPDTCKLKVEWAPNSASSRSNHSELFDVVGREMSKAVLGQTETSESSKSSGYAQATVHNAIRRDLMEARARCIAADITRDVIRPMVELNFGSGIRVPLFEFVTQDSLDLKAFSEAIKNLVVSGLDIPQDWVRDQAGIPEPEGDEALLGMSEEDPEADTAEEIPIDPATGLPKEPDAPAKAPAAP